MHQILEDIILSTIKRANTLPNRTTKPVTARILARSIRSVNKKQHIPVIAEVKPASPTTHNREVSPADAAEIARTMEKAGACAISVLTEPDFFHGSLENLEHVRQAVSIPVLSTDCWNIG